MGAGTERAAKILSLALSGGIFGKYAVEDVRADEGAPVNKYTHSDIGFVNYFVSSSASAFLT
ncbi:MAG: hypothetical protein HQM13_23440 [SAR324 cluster bacterium]|nr:hypothetical protein [SAR324 cluster bacterium]